MTTPFESVEQRLKPILQKWGNGYLVRTKPSGSIAKGTAVASGSDVDVFASVSSGCPNSLEEIYNTLFNALSTAGYSPRRQNVSIGLEVMGYKVDVIPGRRQSSHGNNHSLYRSKTRSWIKTNIDHHISYVRNSGRVAEIRRIKSWRNRIGIEWPSFHLELFVIDELHGCPHNAIEQNLRRVLDAATKSIFRPLIDPANTNNRVSDDMDLTTGMSISVAASNALLSNYI
ncbi:hypothetical protein [Parasphingorhabdus sp.]|uniref:hypothetical protein n=1 Tax=Parasphingorhabdus sp. TaxID=2709688 RepID=UPI003BB14347